VVSLTVLPCVVVAPQVQHPVTAEGSGYAGTVVPKGGTAWWMRDIYVFLITHCTKNLNQIQTPNNAQTCDTKATKHRRGNEWHDIRIIMDLVT